VHVARLVHAELHLPGLGLAHGPRHVEGDRSQFRVGHEPARSEGLAELPHLPHEVGCGDGRVELEPSALDLLHEVLSAHHVGPRLARLALLVSLGEDRHTHRLSDTVGQHDRAAHHLVGMLRVHAQPQRQVHGLVELGAR
jgi:hypothetical protein